MNSNSFIEKAKYTVYDYCTIHFDRTEKMCFTKDDVFVVWFCKVLQNWKALVSTTLNDGMYYEVTYNGDKEEYYLDAYKKWQNLKIDKL